MTTRREKKQSAIYGVVGFPVTHSLSPAMHNAAFRFLGLTATYQKKSIKPVELATFMKQLDSFDVVGLNFTIPHKETVMLYLNSIDQTAAKIGAVNTVIKREGKLIGFNTDADGYWNSLISQCSSFPDLSHVALLGAGGAARAIAYVLCREGCKKLTIVNRTIEKAEGLVKSMNTLYPQTEIQVVHWDRMAKNLESCSLLVNCTSLGLSNRPWPSLHFMNSLPKEAIVSDAVYTPMETELLQKAGKLGLQKHYGYGMLLHQGALAFEKFTNAPAPLDVMKANLIQELI